MVRGGQSFLYRVRKSSTMKGYTMMPSFFADMLERLNSFYFSHYLPASVA